jgi:Skp family chaperone for outer membrane proteins
MPKESQEITALRRKIKRAELELQELREDLAALESAGEADDDDEDDDEDEDL